jgi:hypothetical protein
MKINFRVPVRAHTLRTCLRVVWFKSALISVALGGMRHSDSASLLAAFSLTALTFAHDFEQGAAERDGEQRGERV